MTEHSEIFEQIMENLAAKKDAAGEDYDAEKAYAEIQEEIKRAGRKDALDPSSVEQWYIPLSYLNSIKEKLEKKLKEEADKESKKEADKESKKEAKKESKKEAKEGVDDEPKNQRRR